MTHLVQIQVQVNAQLQWVFYQDPTSQRFIAICEPLKITLEADSNSELRENIEDTLHVFMRSMFEDGDLERFMRDHGWSALNMPKNIAANDLKFDVPFELIDKRSNGSARPLHK